MPSALAAATNYPDPWRGGTWGPRDIMELEMTAVRSVLSMAAKYRVSYLQNFYELSRIASSRETAPGQPLAYVIEPAQGNDEALARLIEILVEQGVEVYRMNHELHMTFVGKGGAAMEIPLGSYVVFLAQPQRWNVQALFERQVYPDRRAANGEAETPYDVAGWTLPLQMGIETLSITAIKEYPSAAQGLTLVKDLTEVRRKLGLAARRDSSTSPIPNPIKKSIRLALYKGSTASMDEGWTRWLFDTYNVSYESLRDNDVRAGSLRDRYDVIVIPSQRASEIIEGNAVGTYPAEFTGGITKAGAENLRRFVEDGGRLICFDAAAEFAIKQFNLPLTNLLVDVKRKDFYSPGSIVGLDVNVKDPIALGYGEHASAYFINSSAFEETDAKRVRVIARYSKNGLLQSGWLIGGEKIAGRIALASVQLGKGEVVLFGFRPQHRGQTWGTFRFIFNAIEGGARAKM